MMTERTRSISSRERMITVETDINSSPSPEGVCYWYNKKEIKMLGFTEINSAPFDQCFTLPLLN